MRIAICDTFLHDLKNSISLIEQFKAQNGNFFNIECFPFVSAVDLLHAVEHGRHFDVIFLDTQLGHMNGIDVAHEIRTYDNIVKLVFLASDSQYAADSYSVNAFYYALKPVWENLIFTLLEKLVEECDVSFPDSIIIGSKVGIHKILLHSLCYVEVSNHTILYRTSSGKVYESFGALQSVENVLLSNHCFFKPHRSFIVNFDYISDITQTHIVLMSSTEIPISKAKRSDVYEKYLAYTASRH